MKANSDEERPPTPEFKEDQEYFIYKHCHSFCPYMLTLSARREIGNGGQDSVMVNSSKYSSVKQNPNDWDEGKQMIPTEHNSIEISQQTETEGSEKKLRSLKEIDEEEKVGGRIKMGKLYKIKMSKPKKCFKI